MNAALAGRGRVLCLTGEPRIGKTWLADEAGAYAASRGMRVYWGRCFEEGGAPAYWPWIQVVRGVVADAGRQYLANSGSFSLPVPADNIIPVI